MANYIDADRMRAEIERLNSLVPYDNNRHDEGLHDAYKAIKNIIDSLQQEQPSLPSNLDEAAEEYIKEGKYLPEAFVVRPAFKAGAEWMAGLGETQEHFVIGSIAGSPCGPAVVCYTEEFAIGDEVIIQIRKK